MSRAPSQPSHPPDLPRSPDAGDAGPPTSWAARLRPYVRRHRRMLVASVAWSCVWVAAIVALPLVQQLIVDDAVVTDRRPVLPLLLLLVALGLARFATSTIWRLYAGTMGLRVQHDVRDDIYDILQRLDLSGHAQLQSGQLVSRANTDLRFVYMLLSWLPLVVSSLLRIALSLVVMTVLSPLLAAIVAATLVVVFVVTNRQRLRVHASGWDAQQREADMTTDVEEAVSGVRVVRAFGRERDETTRLHGSLLTMFGARVRAARLRAPFLATLLSGPVAGQVLVLLVGGLLVLDGQLTVGVFLAFSGYLADLSGTVRALGVIVTTMPQCQAATERIGEILDLRPQVRDPAAPVAPVRAGGAIEIDDVTFAYADGDGHRVLEGFSLSVSAGETIALVGASGSGKSTALQLVPRFLDTISGSVRVDGTDVRRWSQHELRGRIGVVFEDSFLFSDTIAANIAYGHPDATAWDVERVARAAAAHDFVRALPDGYDTVIGEQGLTLSGGQRQRLALARALLTDTDVLLLDNATSSLDVRVEEQIHANLGPFLEGRTTLLVAYRESTVRMADRVVLVDEGRVVAQGSHDELLAGSARYRDLFGDGENDAVDDDATLLPRARSGEFGETASAWASRGDASGHVPSTAMPAPPRLVEAIAALPPPPTSPKVDLATEASTYGAFRLASFLRPYAPGLAVGLLLVVGEAALTLVNPLLVREGVDRGMVGGSAPALLVVCLVSGVLAALLWWDQRSAFLWTASTTERLLLALRVRIFGQLQRLGIDFYDRNQAGRVITRMTSDVDALAELLQVGLVNAVVALASFLGMGVVVMLLDPRLALVVLGVLPPAAAITWWYRRRAVVAYDAARERISSLNANLQESLAGIRVTHAYRREAHNLRRFSRLGREYVDASRAGLFATSVYVATIELLSVLAMVAVLGLGGRYVEQGTLELGTLLAFLLYVAQVFAPIQQMSQVFDVYQRARAGMVRVRELLSLRPSTPDAPDPVRPGQLAGELCLENVSLRYSGATTDALREVDLHVPPGQRVAFVGRTGAGKSTIAKLIARFYDPTSGRVLVDGAPLSRLDLAGYRNQLGYVPQEPFLFSRSIRDNIAYGRPEASDAEVEAAARSVGAHAFVVRLPGGYHHRVSERGRSLSAGQRQLICLARAMVVDPAVLVLDEATSNLDLASERRVNRAMRVASAGRTTLVVTHRPQSLRWADRVVVVADGRIIGDHPATEFVRGLAVSGGDAGVTA